jgi:ATP-dependent 26S proteasome regulatory subunit
MPENPLVSSLLAAVEAAPDDVPLRLHVAGVLAQHGRAAEALHHCSAVLQRDPANAEATALLARITRALTGGGTDQPPSPGQHATPDEPPTDSAEDDPTAEQAAVPSSFDWAAAERQVGDIVSPAFIDTGGDSPTAVEEDIERPGIRLADVGGMDDVKQRLEIAFLGPMRNPEMAKAFGKSLAGGLLLYGPPGCGKTFVARALAGELGARFYPVGIADVLDGVIGNSERFVRELFDTARRNAPCVLFIDELDALGMKRSHLRNAAYLRGLVNSLLAEMDSVAGRSEGVFVLGATNHPWDIDTALRRPGRFDRMLLVLPPDDPAREAILRHHLRDRPLAGIDLGKLVRSTADFSGADLAHLCESATELALADSVRSGQVRPVTMADFSRALKEVKPSTGPWLQTARNVAMFANSDGTYDDLLAYLKRRRMA